MPPIPKLNVRHINKIVRHIAGNVKRLYMPAWGIQKGTAAARGRDLSDRKFPECNTVACFAGWSKLLSIPQKEWKSVFDITGQMVVDENESDFLPAIVTEEAERLGLSRDERDYLFDGTFGSPAKQFAVVKRRLRYLVSERVKLGDKSAKRIKL